MSSHSNNRLPSAKKPYFDNKTSFRLLQQQQEFLEREVAAEERRHIQHPQRATALISEFHELHKVSQSLQKLDTCFTEMSDVMDSYAPRVSKMAKTLWSRERVLVHRLVTSLKKQMTVAKNLQQHQDDLHERDRRLTHQTKRSLGIMNSDVQKLETELLQTETKLNVANKLNESLQAELTRLREQVCG